MKVRLRNPDRIVEVDGPAQVSDMLAQLDINPETVQAFNDNPLVTAKVLVPADAEAEIRPVISGGSHR